MEERVTLPPIRLCSEAADRLAALLVKRSEAVLRAELARYVDAQEPTPGSIVGARVEELRRVLGEYQATGDVRLLNVGVSIHNVTRDNRRRQGAYGGLYGPGVFAELDTPCDECEFFVGGPLEVGSIKVHKWIYSTELTVEDFTSTVVGVPVLPPLEIGEAEAILTEYVIDQAGDGSANPQHAREPFRVFLGHGGGEDWRVLRDELRDHHGFEIEAFEGRPRAGQTIREILEGMAQAATAAVLVLTGSDVMQTGALRGRQNVVHEIGYFQGVIGWERVIVVAEEGIEIFSNLDGTQQVRFPRGGIRAATGAVVASLRGLQG